jgi:hypothetical protein
MGLLLELESPSWRFKKKSVLWIRIVFYADVDPAFYVNADPDQDPNGGF